MPLSISRYFTVVLLAFLGSFLLLPSSKAVNNFFYLFLATPTLILIAFGKVERPRITVLSGFWAAFFVWIALRSMGSDSVFFKYLLYTLLFCLPIWLWVDWRRVQEAQLFQVFFWSIILYVAGSAVFFWLTGRMDVGVRVLFLPSRMEGPILTSMLIVSCFALVLPGWLRDHRWWKIAAALLAILFCVGFVLQSRTGLVGLAVLLAVLFGAALWRGNWWVRSASLVVVILVVVSGTWILQHSEVAARLVARADSGRFELWLLYLKEWIGCGLFMGCGPGFPSEVHLENGFLIPHPHNIFLAMGFRYGLPGVLLFSIAMFNTLREAWQQKNLWGGYLLIALFMLNFDGRELINSPHEVWLLLLLPAMLIAAQQQRGHRTE